MWIGVWDPKKGWHIGGYGEAVVGGAKATDADHSRIGSVTKTFTATAVLQQVAAGKLALTDTIGTLLPDLAAKYPDVAPITVEQLLSMRSGIPDYVNSGLLTQQFLDHPEKVWTADEIIAAVLDKMKVDPSAFSDTNYLILGEISQGHGPGSRRRHHGRRHGARPERHGAAGAGRDGDARPGLGRLHPGRRGRLAQGGGGHGEVGDHGAGRDPVVGRRRRRHVLDGGGPGRLGRQRPRHGHAAAGARRPAPAGPPIKDGMDYGLGIIDWGNGWIGHTGQAVGWEAVVAYNTRPAPCSWAW